MIQQIYPLHQLLKLNTRLFLNATQKIEDKQAQKRVSANTNNLIFIACHVLDARYYLTNYLGDSIKFPYSNIFDEVTKIDEVSEYPPITEVRHHWKNISKNLSDKLPQLSPEQINQNSDPQFPVDDETVLGGITFLMQHESYHIGQLSFIRKLLGGSAMTYE